MKKSLRTGLLVILVIYFASCDTQEVRQTPGNFTGNSVTYSLESTSEFEISGLATIREKKDGSSVIEIQLKNLTSSQLHPVHLHMGDVSTDKAEIAALLNPVNGQDGLSSTDLVRLSNESLIRYKDLLAMEACLKIHLASFGEGQDVVLAAGNIGASLSKGIGSGRYGLGTCKNN